MRGRPRRRLRWPDCSLVVVPNSAAGGAVLVQRGPGLHWADVRDAPTFGELWPVLRSWIEDAEFLAAHNASFDSSVLRACCVTHGVLAPRMPFTCTVQLARAQWKIYPTKLPDVCRALRIPLRHHDSGSDAEACARIVLAAEAEGWRPRRRKVSRTHADQEVTSRNGDNGDYILDT